MFAPGNLVAGRYRLVRLLGEGGMGAVWAAKNEAIDRDVAIKVMLPQIAEDPTALQRFFNEARVCGSIRHPGIVDVLDLGRADDGSPFLVMELLEGESLESRLERERLPLAELLGIVRDVARTIALAHQRGVVHRDLKPANLFLHRIATGERVVKVLDFGISKVLTTDGQSKATRTGMVVGSPAYMSPEQAAGRVELDGRSDVYALGVILYEAIARRLPFEGDNYNSLIIDIATREPKDIAELAPGLPREITQLVRDAMKKDRDARIPSMDALAQRIERALPAAASADAARAADASGPSSVVVGGRSDATLASARTASALTTSVHQPRRAARWVPVAGVLGALLGGAIAVAAIVHGRGGDAGASGVVVSASSPSPARAPGSEATATPSAPVVIPSGTAPAAPERPAGTGEAPAASASPAIEKPAEKPATDKPAKPASEKPTHPAAHSAPGKPASPGSPAQPKSPNGAWGYD